MPNKIKVVLDTNVFISAILFKGKPAKIFEMGIFEGKIEISISPEILAELVGKLKYKFGIDESLLIEIKDYLSSKLNYILPEYETRICRDTDDNKIIDLAISSNSNYIITGDKDLLEIKKYKGVRIVRPEEFLDIFKL
ncbi:MAG: putative toxin-antitoxin system toxin component, PIN family [Actinobacteria bacterium]|nr:putative toxin-antitoxin system toxin component, PIN family [Actinomycetota bacterium]